MVISGGNQPKLERLARELVKGLTVADVGAVVAGTINTAVEERLCSAADVNFPKHERRIRILEKTIELALSEDTRKLFDEYSELYLRVAVAHERANFALGYAAAERLICPPSKRA